MSADHNESGSSSQQLGINTEGQPTSDDLTGYPERRTGDDRRDTQDRRKGKDRRTRRDTIDFEDRRDGKERRSGKERRKGERRKRSLRIPIFVKLVILSTLLILFVISAISFSMLRKQKEQFTSQLINLGKSMVRIATNNAPDKLLGEEDLALIQLVRDIAQNDQVLYALITDSNNVIKAHSRIDNVGKTYLPPGNVRLIRRERDLRIGVRGHDEDGILFFVSPLTYQKLRIGEVHIAISQERILQSISDAKAFVWVLTAIITALGILFSLGLSIYFSSPIRKLGETTRALGMGDLNHRVSIDRNDEFGDLAYSFNRMAEDLELKEKIKDSFGRYVTPEIVDMILRNPDDQWMKGSQVEATVLFVDIRGFTTLSEDKEAEGIVELLNEYFTRVTHAVLKNGGHLNNFLGDAAMAVFGAPVSNPKHAEAAVKAALAIQEEIEKLNWENKWESVTIPVGIGINSGEMVAGNLGSQKRMQYTVIGDNVNVASRVTSLLQGM